MNDDIKQNKKIHYTTEKLIRCHVCNKPNRASARFCGVCGARFDEDKSQKVLEISSEESYFERYIICPSCSKSNRYKASFCSSCRCDLQNLKKTLQEQENENNGLKEKSYLVQLEDTMAEVTSMIEDIPIESRPFKLARKLDRVKFIIEQVKQRYHEKDKLNTEKLSVINAIVKAVNQSLDLETILSNTLDKTLMVTKADAGILMFIDKETSHLIPVAFKGVSPNLVEELKQTSLHLERGTHGRAYLLGKSVKAVEENSSPLTDALVMKGSLVSIVSVPLKSENEVVGIMSIGSRKSDAFSDEDMKLLDSIGNQIGIALRNARLYSLVKNQVGELEEKNKKLKELEVMKNNLTQMIVHDLKNPLMGITGYIDILLMDSEIFDEDQLLAINMISVSSKNLMRMILNLLDISKIEERELTLQKSEIILEEIIDKISDEFKPLLNVENKKILKLVHDVPVFNADKDLLYRIIANLVSNAISHSPPNKNIKIVAYPNENKTELIISVEDKGIGIPQEYQEKIFNKFFQADATHKSAGTSRGLGLTFCKMAIEAHGGTIQVKSSPGVGSKFSFTLPL